MCDMMGMDMHPDHHRMRTPAKVRPDCRINCGAGGIAGPGFDGNDRSSAAHQFAVPSIRAKVAMSSSDRAETGPNLWPVVWKMAIARRRDGTRWPLRIWLAYGTLIPVALAISVGDGISCMRHCLQIAN